MARKCHQATRVVVWRGGTSLQEPLNGDRFTKPAFLLDTLRTQLPSPQLGFSLFGSFLLGETLFSGIPGIKDGTDHSLYHQVVVLTHRIARIIRRKLDGWVHYLGAILIRGSAVMGLGELLGTPGSLDRCRRVEDAAGIPPLMLPRCFTLSATGAESGHSSVSAHASLRTHRRFSSAAGIGLG